MNLRNFIFTNSAKKTTLNYLVDEIKNLSKNIFNINKFYKKNNFSQVVNFT